MKEMASWRRMIISYSLVILVTLLILKLGWHVVYSPDDGHINLINDEAITRVLPHSTVSQSELAVCKSIIEKKQCMLEQNCGWCIDTVTKSCVDGTENGAENRQCSTWCFRPDTGKCRAYKKLIVLGNGPSLKGFDFFKTKGVATIGMNLAFRYWKQINWWPTYYTSFDTVVNVAHIPDLVEMIENSEKYGIKLFFTRANIQKKEPKLRLYPKVKYFENIKASSNLNMVTLTRKELSTGAVSARVGQYLGYEKILLLGIDMNYVEHINGSADQRDGTLIMKETPKNNSNYFFNNYQQQGDVYNVPFNEKFHIVAFEHVLEDVDRHPELNVEYFNGSPVSRLNGIGFNFMTFEDFMKL